MQHNVTPVSTATQSVSRLQTLLAGRQASPSDTLLELFKYVQLFAYSIITKARISMHYQTLKHACIHAQSYDKTCTLKQKNNTNMQF